MYDFLPLLPSIKVNASPVSVVQTSTALAIGGEFGGSVNTAVSQNFATIGSSTVQ